MSITPIPIILGHSESKCPKCGKSEEIKEICAHCGYEYPEENESLGFGLFILKAIPIIILIIWVVLTLTQWVIDHCDYGDERTLLEIIAAQWEFIKSLKVW